MKAVWPVTALYFAPLAYRRWGLSNGPRYQQETGVRPASWMLSAKGNDTRSHT